MSSIDQAYETQLKNIQAKTGKSLDELYAFIRASGLTKHGQIRDMLRQNLGLGHGDANTIALFYLKYEQAPATQYGDVSRDDVLDEIYSGARAALRPVHDELMVAISKFGPFEIAPKKGYVSLRRRKQFAMIGPATKTRVEVGLNMKGVEPSGRLVALPAGGMCQYKVEVTDAAEVDAELIGWVKQAYDSAA